MGMGCNSFFLAIGVFVCEDDELQIGMVTKRI